MGDSWERGGACKERFGFPWEPASHPRTAHLHALLFQGSSNWPELEANTSTCWPSPSLCVGLGNTPETPKAHNEPLNYPPPRAGQAAPLHQLPPPPAPPLPTETGLRLRLASWCGL